MAVAYGDQRRRLDAIELLVGEITSTQNDWNSDSIPLAIRNALEVRTTSPQRYIPSSKDTTLMKDEQKA